MSLLRRSGDANAASQIDTAKTLANKYSMTKLQFLKGPTDCFDNNGKKQLTDPFDSAVVLDKTQECVFNLLVCDIPANNKDGVMDACKNQGLDV